MKLFRFLSYSGFDRNTNISHGNIGYTTIRQMHVSKKFIKLLCAIYYKNPSKKSMVRLIELKNLQTNLLNPLGATVLPVGHEI